jgi:M6 family metalloprotease domain
MLKKLKLHILLLIVTISYFQVLAVPAIPEPISITQPDGSQITVYLRGDEFFHFHTTIDGVLIKQNSDNIFHYAQINCDNKIEISSVKANNPELRTVSEKTFVKTLNNDVNSAFVDVNQSLSIMRAAAVSESPIQRFPVVGSPRGLVILVNFSDNNFVVPNPQAAFTNLLNQPNYNTNGGTGSARDYFIDASNGVFTPEFDVVGPFTLPNPSAYYDENDGHKINQFVIEACALADSAGVDFALYDTDNNGIVDNVFIYYAGYNEAEGGGSNTIWPHRYGIYYPPYTTMTFDGKLIGDYACSSELRGRNGNNMCGIGTFVHEFSHVLDLPDLYATNNASHATLGYWDVMDYGPYSNGGRTPPTYSAYERFFMGWLTPIEISTPLNDTIEAIHISNKAFLVSNTQHNMDGKNPNPTEFYLIENRQKTGWDTYLPGHGMLITRINYNRNRWNNNSVNNSQNSMGVRIIPAGGSNSSNGSGSDPFPGTANVNNYNIVISGTSKSITHIKEQNGVINFRFMGGEDMPNIYYDGSFSAFETVCGTPSEIQTFKVYGKKLIAPLNISFSNNIHFEIKTELDSVWSNTLTFIPQNLEVDTTVIQVRYNPNLPSIDSVHNETITLSSTSADDVTINILGTSTRDILVVPPVANEAAQVTDNSFVASWEAVYDATGYYLSVYTMSDDESSQTEGFNQGLTLPSGWSTNSTNTRNTEAYCGVAIPSIELRNTGSFLQTETYNYAVKRLSFYARSVSASGSSLYVKALKGNSYISIDTISVNLALANTFTYEFDENDNYTAFYFEYLKNNGSVAIDDVAVSFNKTINNVTSGKWTEELTDTIRGLADNTDYYYKVRASDKTLDGDGSVLYENITDFSNIIYIKTAPNGLPVILSDVVTGDVYVYSITGQLLYRYEDGQKFNINDLPASQIFIIKTGNKAIKVIR